ncbi:MAG TPA: deoxyribodipyrimidine photo-lyase [Roseomonas sp.]|nr:deoxyribodipyrimidine photo-lyase [Roseomonas sp.]
MTEAPTLLWLRQDLRVADNPALHAAAGGPVLPVFVLDESAAGRWATGGAGRWWLHHSLAALGAALAERGAPLLLLRGDTHEVIPALAARIGAAAVHAGRQHAPWTRARDEAVAEALRRDGRSLHLHDGALLIEPERLRNGQGRPYAIYTPFARAVMALGDPPPPVPAPRRLHGVQPPGAGLALDELGLLPRPDWAAAFPDYWTPGEAAAQARLHEFLEDAAGEYDTGRDIPGEDGTSRLSPHLHWGELSARQVWHGVMQHGGQQGGRGTFLREILWREFSHHLLWHRPELPEQPLRSDYARFPYQPDHALLRAWQQGRTGYPIVDAGMRQLWQHGWMHNRVRMVAASLLVKQLLQPWWDGAAWFWDTLVDADLANNSANWQWVAGCGTDATPYFRIFNPVLQGRKFDADGAYVRTFVPELARLPDRWLHEPWSAPAEVLRGAGVVLGRTYPAPVVEPEAGRARALAALRGMKAAE